MKISERISQIIDNENISVRSFEAVIGCSNGIIAKCVSKGSDIGSIWTTKIVENYPQYNAKWLITGKDPMLKSDTYNNASSPPAPSESNALVEHLEKVIDKKDVK